MLLPTGSWQINTYGYEGTLTIASVDAQGNVTGTLQVDPQTTHNISGTWDESNKKLSFYYRQNLLYLVSYLGYLFQAGQPLFGQIGTINPPTWNVLAGTWRAGILLNPFSFSSGWVARLGI